MCNSYMALMQRNSVDTSIFVSLFFFTGGTDVLFVCFCHSFKFIKALLLYL